MNFREFIKELLVHFREPEDAQRMFDALGRRLEGQSSDTLQAIADRVIDSHAGKSWPAVSEFMDALRQVTSAGNRSVPGAGWEAKRKARQAKASAAADEFMAMSAVARTAKAEGWAHPLRVLAENFAFSCMRNGEDQPDLQRMQAYLTFDLEPIAYQRARATRKQGAA